MGYILKACCESCKYESEVRFGVGMRMRIDFLEVPAMVKHNKTIATRNICDLKVNNNIIYYTDPQMFRGNMSDEAITVLNFSIKLSENFCPKCEKYTVRFEEHAYFD